MLRQLEGSRAVALAVAACRPQVVCAYPITPQTHIVEGVGELVKSGELAGCEFINVESEFAAMSVAIGASAAGSRAYTATSSQGLLFMIEAVYNVGGLGLPVVMTLANRAIGAPINIWNDHSDAMAVRDAGWVMLFAESNQEATDLHIQAFRLAEDLSLPVMVNMDGFVLTHATERIDVPTQEQVDAFLPPFEPRQVLDPADPVTIGALVGPEAFTEVRFLAHAKQLQAIGRIREVADEFAEAFGRRAGGLVNSYRVEDADVVVVALGSILGTIKDVADEMRERRDKGRSRRDHLVPPVPAGGAPRGDRGRPTGSGHRAGIQHRLRRRVVDRCGPGHRRWQGTHLHCRRRPRRPGRPRGRDCRRDRGRRGRPPRGAPVRRPRPGCR